MGVLKIRCSPHNVTATTVNVAVCQSFPASSDIPYLFRIFHTYFGYSILISDIPYLFLPSVSLDECVLEFSSSVELDPLAVALRIDELDCVVGEDLSCRALECEYCCLLLPTAAYCCLLLPTAAQRFPTFLISISRLEDPCG